jgi:hypothetical protein
MTREESASMAPIFGAQVFRTQVLRTQFSPPARYPAPDPGVAALFSMTFPRNADAAFPASLERL